MDATIYILEKRWTKCRGGVTSTGKSCSRKLVEMGEGKKAMNNGILGHSMWTNQSKMSKV
jgi:hypothetical protein